MITCGVDPSSTKIGVAFLECSEILAVSTIDVKKIEGDIGTKIVAATFIVAELIEKRRPELTAIELVSVQHNMNTVRKIAYFEAACLAGAHGNSKKVAQVKTTTARKAALGNGGLSKVEAIAELEALYNREFAPDEADAVILALWAQAQLEPIAGL